MGIILVILEQFGHLLSQCKIYELLHLGEKPHTQETANLESALIRLYAEILHFLSMEIQLYEKKNASPAILAFSRSHEVADRAKKIEKLGEYVDYKASLCESVSGDNTRSIVDKQAKHMVELFIETREPLVRVGSQVSYVDDMLSLAERYEVLCWTSTVPFDEDHYEARRGRTDGTGHWLLEHELYRKWRISSTSMVLWLHGGSKLSLYCDSSPRDC